MKFGILSAKHHDGLCLWNSANTENDVAASPWKDGKGDLVRDYVDAFRERGLAPCLYYSVWDNTQGVGNRPVTEADMDFVKGQLRELLTGYGPVKMLFIDGWSWKMGHRAIPYDEIHTLVKDLQPTCLLVDNTHLRCMYDNDLIHYEAGSAYPVNNTFPAIFSLLINKNSGNGCFWDSRVSSAELMTVDEIFAQNLNVLDPQWCNLILNCPPDTSGRLDDRIVERLKEVGSAWKPDPARSPLPAQPPHIDYPVTPVSATASSGDAEKAVDGINDRYFYSVWESDTTLPQIITIDLGKIYPGIIELGYVPKYKPYIDPVTDGSIKVYRIYTSADSREYQLAASGQWDGVTLMKIVRFRPTEARYVRLECLSAVDDFAAATEFAIGRGKAMSGR